MMISLDYHSTTPIDPAVLDAMRPFFHEQYWNPHSPHAGGQRAARAVENARAKTARLIGAAPSEIVFTSGATEANNLAILGIAQAALAGGVSRRRILTSAIEHKCVLEAARHLSTVGFEHQVIPVGENGIIDVDTLREAMDDDVLLVSIMAASNEIGTIQPLDKVSELAEAAGAIFHVDAAQAIGRVPFDVFEIGCDLASFSSHKMYGPNGIGALFISAASPSRPHPIMFGGGQEQGLRPGTLAVPLIVGFGRAAELAEERLSDDEGHLRSMASLFLAELEKLSVPFALNGAASPRLPGSINIRIRNAVAEDVIQRLGNRLHLSTGSACTSGELQGSYVLDAIGLRPQDVSSSFRICFGREHDKADAIAAAKLLAEALSACHNATGGGVQQRGSKDGKIHVAGIPTAVCGT